MKKILLVLILLLCIGLSNYCNAKSTNIFYKYSTKEIITEGNITPKELNKAEKSMKSYDVFKSYFDKGEMSILMKNLNDKGITAGKFYLYDKNEKMQYQIVLDKKLNGEIIEFEKSPTETITTTTRYKNGLPVKASKQITWKP